MNDLMMKRKFPEEPSFDFCRTMAGGHGNIKNAALPKKL